MWRRAKDAPSAAAEPGIGKLFLRGGLLGVAVMEGIQGLKSFGEELLTGGERAKKMTEEVSRLRGEMSRLAYETAMAADSVGDLQDGQAKLLSGELSGESPLEKLAGKQLTPKIKKEFEDILKEQDKQEKEARKRLDEDFLAAY